MPEPLIKNVADTAFWIAYLRAVESRRPDALFRDPFAARLAGEHGRRIAEAMPMARVIGWNVAIRTCIVDDQINLAIADGCDCVVNLGAGLDTRPYRMELAPSLQWIEVDYPHIIEYKQTLLAGDRCRCRLERVKIDLASLPARRKLFAAVKAQANKVLVVTEGVVPYLTVEEVASLADDLTAFDHVSYWIVDYMRPEALKFRQRMGMRRTMQNAPFRFEPPDWFAFFREHGWRPKEMRYIAVEAERLHRPIPLPVPIMLGMMLRMMFASPGRYKIFRELMGYALLERTCPRPGPLPQGERELLIGHP